MTFLINIILASCLLTQPKTTKLKPAEGEVMGMDEKKAPCYEEELKNIYKEFCYGSDDKENIEYAALQILAVLRTCKIRVGSVRAVFNEVERKIQQIARV